MKAVHVAASEAEKSGIAGEWGSEVWVANQSLIGSSVTVGRLLLHAGHSGRTHRHPNADEVIYLIRGQVRVRTGSESTLLQSGDGLSIPAGLIHQIENVGTEDAEMTLSYSTGEREYAAE